MKRKLRAGEGAGQRWSSKNRRKRLNMRQKREVATEQKGWGKQLFRNWPISMLHITGREAGLEQKPLKGYSPAICEFERKMESADNEAEHKRRSAKFSGVL
jgi:hypothetical protein